MNPYEPPSKTAKNQKQRDQAGLPTPVPDLDDVEPFMSGPDFVAQPMSELEALLTSQYLQNPYPYPGNTEIPPSYSCEPPESTPSINLKKQVRHTLANAWRYDPVKCSVKAAVKAARELAASHHHGLTKDEYSWVAGAKSTAVKKARSAARRRFERAIRPSKWMKNSDWGDHFFKSSRTNIDQEIDEFYGLDSIDLRSVENESNDEGFSEPNVIATTIVSLPNKSLLEEGVTPGGIFQDSGILMDEGYAEYSLAHSAPPTAQGFTGMPPGDWPTLEADVAPLRRPKRTGRWLPFVGNQKQCDWPGRRQGPYGVDDLDNLEEPEVVTSDPQDAAGSFTPEPATREASPSRDVDTEREAPLPVEATSSIESVKLAQETSESKEGTVVDELSEATPQSLGQGQPHSVHGANDIGDNIEIEEQNCDVPTSSKDIESKDASEVAPQLVSEARPQHFGESSKSGRNNGSSTIAPNVARATPQYDTDTNTQARRKALATAFTTPVTQRIRQIQQVQPDTPPTPATVNINLTPEYDSDMDTTDVSDVSLEARLSDSPTANTQMGQSALSRYVQETKSHPNLARQSINTMSSERSDYEEVSLVPSPEHASQPEGHAGFRTAVELHQEKSDAVFTLSGAPKAPPASPSSSTIAPIPVTPAHGNDTVSFRPITPFQLNSPAHAHSESPGTPTPAPKASISSGKSVKNIFGSSKLASRSPERAAPSSDIVVAPTTPTTAGASGGRYGGSQGLLFQKAKKKERGTKNVLNSLRLSPERGSGSGSSVKGDLEDYEDELAGGSGGVEVDRGGRWVREMRGPASSGVDLGAKGGRKVARAVVVPSVRSREEGEDGGRAEGVQSGEPRKKKQRRSTRAGPAAAGGAYGSEAGTSFFQR